MSVTVSLHLNSNEDHSHLHNIIIQSGLAIQLNFSIPYRMTTRIAASTKPVEHTELSALDSGYSTSTHRHLPMASDKWYAMV